jgi:beta-lactamase regulating signal transducer with metallopeptidase domain
MLSKNLLQISQLVVDTSLSVLITNIPLFAGFSMSTQFATTLSSTTRVVTALSSTTQPISLETVAQQTTGADPEEGGVSNIEIRNIIIILIAAILVFIGSILLALYVWRRQEKKMARPKGFELDAESQEVVLPKQMNELEGNPVELEGTRHFYELAAAEKRRSTGTNAGIGTRPSGRAI